MISSVASLIGLTPTPEERDVGPYFAPGQYGSEYFDESNICWLPRIEDHYEGWENGCRSKCEMRNDCIMYETVYVLLGRNKKIEFRKVSDIAKWLHRTEPFVNRAIKEKFMIGGYLISKKSKRRKNR